jgi:chloramphenicol-sensitive protein RarD
MNISPAHLAAICAFSLWGLFPLYWKLFSDAPAWDLFGHRLIWSFLTLYAIIFFQKKMSVMISIWKNQRIRYMLIVSSILISSNWLLYIYAVNQGKVLEASMGYFLNPLINVLVGGLILKESIRLTQWPAIILAILSILLIAFQTDLSSFPWIALILSLTFALYGLIRKMTPVGSMEGLTFETTFVILPTLIYWSLLSSNPTSLFSQLPGWKMFLLSLSGLITCIPLILFAFSTQRLKLQTLGFIQYLSPSLKFVCGWLILNEPLGKERLMTFFLIWVALLWYTMESFFHLKKEKRIIPVTTE